MEAMETARKGGKGRTTKVLENNDRVSGTAGEVGVAKRKVEPRGLRLGMWEPPPPSVWLRANSFLFSYAYPIEHVMPGCGVA